MAEFIWFPDASMSKRVEPRVATARFGDGYEMRVPMGINTMPQSWEVSFTGVAAEIDAIEGFLAARQGAEAFDWTTPDGTTGRFLCRSWSKTRERGGAKTTLTATFEQVFGT